MRRETGYIRARGRTGDGRGPDGEEAPMRPAAEEGETRPMGGTMPKGHDLTTPEACCEILAESDDPVLRGHAVIHLLKLIEAGAKVEEGRIKDLQRNEREPMVRTRLKRVLNKLGFRKLLGDDPAAFYDPKLSSDEELRLYQEIDRLKGVFDKSKGRKGAFDEQYIIFDVELGKGGMARILKGMRRADRLPVAFKYLMLEKLARYATKETLTGLFMNEGNLITERLDHPGVIKGFDYGVSEGDYFIVMEYIEGGSLYDMVRATAMDMALFSEIGSELCDAVAYIHGEGVIHRDLNPKNVLVERAGGSLSIKLIDFGLALDRRGGFRAPPVFRGYNEPYTSPEQRAHFNDVDERDDIYSMGVLFYEILGKDPRGGALGTACAIPERVRNGLDRCMEKERDKRWDSVHRLKGGVFGEVQRLRQ